MTLTPISKALTSLVTAIWCRGVRGFVDDGNNEAVHYAGYRENDNCNSADSEEMHWLQI